MPLTLAEQDLSYKRMLQELTHEYLFTEQEYAEMYLFLESQKGNYIAGLLERIKKARTKISDFQRKHKNARNGYLIIELNDKHTAYISIDQAMEAKYEMEQELKKILMGRMVAWFRIDERADA